MVSRGGNTTICFSAWYFACVTPTVSGLDAFYLSLPLFGGAAVYTQPITCAVFRMLSGEGLTSKYPKPPAWSWYQLDTPTSISIGDGTRLVLVWLLFTRLGEVVARAIVRCHLWKALVWLSIFSISWSSSYSNDACLGCAGCTSCTSTSSRGVTGGKEFSLQ